MNRLTAFALALLLAAPVAFLPTPAAANHETPSGWPPNATGRLHFMRLNETVAPTTPFDDVHGTGAVVMLNVTDTGLTEATVNVTVTSTSDIAGEEIILHRVRAGVYHGFLGFETALVANNGEIYVQDRDRVQAVYRDHQDANNAAAVSQDRLTWFSMADGRILLDETTYVGSAARPRITVLDRLVPATTPTFAVDVNSTSDPRPVRVVLNRTADGQYEGSLAFVPITPVCVVACTGALLNNAVRVRSGDAFTVSYNMTGRNVRGHDEDPQVSARWEQRHTAVLQILADDVKTVRASSAIPGAPPMLRGVPTDGGIFVRLEDPDLRGQRNVTVNLFSTGVATGVDPTGINLLLTEVGSNTGEFTGTAGFITGAPSVGKRLRVADGATVTARYTDARNAAGGQSTVFVSGVWDQTSSADISFHNSGFTAVVTTANPRWVPATHADACLNATSVRVACHPDQAFIQVRDLDLSSSAAPPATLTVRVTSTRDSLGIPLTLTGVNTDSTPGIDAYRGSVRFNFTHSNTTEPFPPVGPTASVPVIWLLCGETMTVTVAEDETVTGLPGKTRRTLATVGSTGGCTSSGPAIPTAAALNLRILRTETDVTRITADGTFTVELRDNVQNRNTTGIRDPLRRTLVPSSDSHPAGWFSVDRSEIQSASTPKLNVTGGQETAVNSNLFRGTFVVGSDPGELPAAVGDDVCVHWLHKNATGRNTVLISRCVPFEAATAASQSDAVLALRDRVQQGQNVTEYNGFETAVVWLVDNDRGADTTNNTDNRTVTVRSTSDTTGITVSLRERYGHHRMGACDVQFGACPGSGTRDDRAFFGTFQFTTGASVDAGDLIKVADDDFVTVFYNDPRTAAGGSATFSTAVQWHRATTATIALNAPVYRLDQDGDIRARVTVVDADRDTGPAVQTLDVRVENERSGNSTTLTLTETSGSSGVFSGLLAFNPEEKPTRCGAGAPPPICTVNQILVRDEDFFRVRYEDMDDASGQRVNVTARAQWFDINAARLLLDRAKYSTTSDNANVTLDDRDRDVTSFADEVFVQVTSDSDGNGVRLRLVETGARTGIFTGRFGFETPRAAGNDRVAVADGDRVSVHYIDREVDGDGREDPDEFRHKRADALWRALSNRPPVLNITTVPPLNALGRVAIDANDRVNFTVTVSDPDGTIAMWELDYGDNQRDSGVGPVTARVFRHTFRAGASVVLKATDNEGLQNQTTIPVVLRGLDDDPPGAITDLSVADARITSVVLRWTTPQNNATARDNAAPLTYDVRYSTSPIITEGAFRAATAPGASQLLFAPVPLARPGQRQEVTITGLTAGTEYTFAVAAKDVGGNAGPFDTVNATLDERDTTAPSTPTLRSSHPRNQPSTINTIEFNWTTVTDESPVRYVFLLDSQASTQLADLTAGFRSNGTSFVYNGIVDGTYHFHLAACSDGGCSATTHYGPIIIRTAAPLTAAQIEAANKAVQIQVVREGGDNVVRWALPSSPPAPIEGVQIWRSTSPFELLTTVERGDAEFQEGEYIDRGAPADAKYLVTVFFGRTAAEGYSSGPSDEVPGFVALGDGEGIAVGESRIPMIFWVLMAVGVVVVLLLVFGLILVWRRRPEDEEAWTEQPPPAAAPAADPGLAWAAPPPESEPPAEEHAWNLEQDEEYTVAGVPETAPPVPAPLPPPAPPAPPVDPNTHHLTCPSCGADFTAIGPKPLVTECPSCGVRGILR